MRYKYSQNLTEASEMTFAENEYQGIEQNGTMKRIPTTEVKQGVHDALHDHIDFTTTPLADTNTVGRLLWDDDSKTLSIVRDNTGGTKVSVEIGDEIQVRVKNTTGTTILNGQPVYTTSALGNTPLIALADGDDPSKNRVTGLMTADIANNGVSYLTTVGLVRQVPIANIIDPADTSWTVGTYLYLSTVTGKLTKNRPSVDTAVRVGIITDISGSNCTILVYLRDDYAKIFDDIDNAISTIKGTGYTEGSLKTHEDRLDTLEGTGEGSVAKAIDDAVSPLEKVINKEIVNGGFENDSTAWGTVGSSPGISSIDTTTVFKGTKSLKHTATAQSIFVYQNIVYPQGHKIYVCVFSLMESLVTGDTSLAGRLGVSDYDTLSTNIVRSTFTNEIGTWELGSVIKEVIDNAGIRVTLGRGIATEHVCYYDSVITWDLTDFFGEGNEPEKAIIDEIIKNFVGTTDDEQLEMNNAVGLIKLLVGKADKTYVDDAIENIEANPWKGKKAVIIGDSITASGAGTTNFSNVMATELEMTITNYGINGSMIAVQESSPSTRDPIVTRYDDMSDDADICIVAGGTNDWQYGLCPFGTMADRTDYTFYGAMHNLCAGLMDKYIGDNILFLTPIKRMQADLLTQESTNANGKTLFDYCDAIIEVCGYYGIPVLDMNRECPLDPHIASHMTAYFDESGTHPNAAGHVIMAKRLTGYMRQLR